MCVEMSIHIYKIYCEIVVWLTEEWRISLELSTNGRHMHIQLEMLYLGGEYVGKITFDSVLLISPFFTRISINFAYRGLYWFFLKFLLELQPIFSPVNIFLTIPISLMDTLIFLPQCFPHPKYMNSQFSRDQPCYPSNLSIFFHRLF